MTINYIVYSNIELEKKNRYTMYDIVSHFKMLILMSSILFHLFLFFLSQRKEKILVKIINEWQRTFHLKEMLLTCVFTVGSVTYLFDEGFCSGNLLSFLLRLWHKALWKGHPMRLELTRVGLLVQLANHYTTRGALRVSVVSTCTSEYVRECRNIYLHNVHFYSYCIVYSCTTVCGFSVSPPSLSPSSFFVCFGW